MPNPFIALIRACDSRKNLNEQGDGEGSHWREDFLSQQQVLYLYLLYLLD